jgi:hypothetical protein
MPAEGVEVSALQLQHVEQGLAGEDVDPEGVDEQGRRRVRRIRVRVEVLPLLPVAGGAALTTALQRAELGAAVAAGGVAVVALLARIQDAVTAIRLDDAVRGAAVAVDIVAVVAGLVRILDPVAAVRSPAGGIVDEQVGVFTKRTASERTTSSSVAVAPGFRELGSTETCQVPGPRRVTE